MIVVVYRAPFGLRRSCSGQVVVGHDRRATRLARAGRSPTVGSEPDLVPRRTPLLPYRTAHQVPRTPCTVGRGCGGRNSVSHRLCPGGRRGPITRVPDSVRSAVGRRASPPPVDQRPRLAPRHTGGEPAMKHDTDNSGQPTLWGETTLEPGRPARGGMGLHVNTARLRKPASCGRLMRSPITSASPSRPSTAGAQAGTDRLVSVSANTCVGARRRSSPGLSSSSVSVDGPGPAERAGTVVPAMR